MGFDIRVASVHDARSLSEFAAAVFRDTFAADNQPGDVAAYLAESFSVERQAAEIEDPEGIVLLAESAEAPTPREPAGYAHLVAGAAPPAVTGPAPLELKRLYVASRWHGRGVARELMDAAIRAARARGARTLWLGVWERNPRAINFYRKCGFVHVGEHTFLLGSDRQTDWIFELALTDDRL